MASALPELLIPSILALLCALYPAPWHIRNRNIATLGMIFWMSALNIVHIVNCILWYNNADNKAQVWADISVMITMMYNYGLPLSHLILSRQLESCTSLRTDSPLYDSPSRHRARILDLSLAIAGPIVGFLVSLSCRAGRFLILEAYGPMPAVYWDTWGVVWVAIIPIVIAFMCFGYTCKACYNIIRRRQQMLSIISKNASLDKSHFVRLLILAIAELGTCMLRAIFNMTWGTQRLDRLRWNSALKSFTTIRLITLAEISTRDRLVYNLSWFTVVACSMVFFLCFATSFETKRFYWGILERILPPVRQYRRRKEQEEEDKIKLNSYASESGLGSRGFDATNSEFSNHKDLSLVDMVSPHTLQKHDTGDDRTGELVKERDVESAAAVSSSAEGKRDDA